MRLCRGDLSSVHACCLPHGDKQDGLRYLAFLFRRSRSPSHVLVMLARLSVLAGSLRGCAFISGDLDGLPGTRERGTGLAALVRFCAVTLALKCFPRGVRWGYAPQTAPKSLRLSGLSSRCGGAGLVRIRGLCTLLRNHIGLAALSAGSTLGLRAPDCAKESSTLWTLFTLRRG